MKLTRATTYAVHALAYMASRKEGGTIASHEVARARGIPDKFLPKLFKPLVQARVLLSMKGPNGGYRLARAAEKITILEIIEAVEGPLYGEAAGLDGDGAAPVDGQLQAVCGRATELVRRDLSKVRLSDLVGEGR